MEERGDITSRTEVINEGSAYPRKLQYIEQWFAKAQVDYAQQYILLYSAYNAWYREVTGDVSDRSALNMLKKRVVMWDEYARGTVMSELRLIMRGIVEVTHREPLRVTRTVHWSGEVQDVDDWRGLIEYWYRVRCLIVHGDVVGEQYVYLAYESLRVFLGEVIARMNESKYDIFDIWNVDMRTRDNTSLRTLQKAVY